MLTTLLGGALGLALTACEPGAPAGPADEPALTAPAAPPTSGAAETPGVPDPQGAPSTQPAPVAGAQALAAGAPWTSQPVEPISSPHLRVDAFGWTPDAPGRALVREPAVGHDAPAPYTPGAALQALDGSTDQLVASLPLQPWRDGEVHSGSGDRLWTADLSPLGPGHYRLEDPASGARSEPFRIGHDVYDDVLAAAVRMLYHQRCGTPKLAPFTDPAWTDASCHRGPDQDDQALPASGAGPALDLHGGWHDAGDYGKYVNFADDAVHDLLSAYEEAPELFGDDLGLPESGNGLPDLLDEVRWQLDWMLRMQRPDGGLLHKLHVVDFAAASPPSADAAPRRYAPATHSATVSGAGAFAHAARVFAGLGHPDADTYAAELTQAAERAWDWADAHPGPSSYDNAGFVNAVAEDDAHWQLANRLRAAAHLLARTGDPAYRDWFDTHHDQTHLMQWSYALVYEQGLLEGLLVYASLPQATPAVAQALRQTFAQSVGGSWHLGNVLSVEDPYGAWLADADVTWGSNRTRAQQGRLFAHMLRFGLDPQQASAYHAASQAYVHAFHGLNPPGHTYLTALHQLGAPASLDQTYHAWFADGSDWDDASLSPLGPAPGLLVGGPNWYYAPDPSYGGTLEPPQAQPPLKAYRDWNTGWPENSWEVSECQLSYQAAYVALLAHVARRPAWTDLGSGLAGTSAPRLTAVGPLTPGSANALILDQAPASTTAGLFFGWDEQPVPFQGGLLLPSPLLGPLLLGTDPEGRLELPFVVPSDVPPGSPVVVQWALPDEGAPLGTALSNALRGEVRP